MTLTKRAKKRSQLKLLIGDRLDLRIAEI